MAGWKLKRTNQCPKCPWRTDADPYEIPNGYSEDLHRQLACTIAQPGDMRATGHVFACQEHDAAEGVHCVGWLVNQLGPGNNIPLRIKMMSCDNARAIRTHGEQHRSFEETLPESASVDRNPEGEDRHGLRAQHESAVPSAETADAQTPAKSLNPGASS